MINRKLVDWLLTFMFKFLDGTKESDSTELVALDLSLLCRSMMNPMAPTRMRTTPPSRRIRTPTRGLLSAESFLDAKPERKYVRS